MLSEREKMRNFEVFLKKLFEKPLTNHPYCGYNDTVIVKIAFLRMTDRQKIRMDNSILQGGNRNAQNLPT